MNCNEEAKLPAIGPMHAAHDTNHGVAQAEKGGDTSAATLWTSEYSAAADPQGWNLFTCSEELQIQRDDEAAVFPSDEAAAKHVQAMAEVLDPVAIRAIYALVAAGSSNVALYRLKVPEGQHGFTIKDLLEANAAGFQIQQGTPSHGADLDGRWWWTLSQPGWSEAESSRGDFDSAATAWADAVRFLRQDSSLSGKKPEAKVIRLDAFNIAVTLTAGGGGHIKSSLHEDGESSEEKAALDAVESLILAHAAAGIDVNSARYLEGIETTVQAIWNQFAE